MEVAFPFNQRKSTHKAYALRAHTRLHRQPPPELAYISINMHTCMDADLTSRASAPSVLAQLIGKVNNSRFNISNLVLNKIRHFIL